MLAEACALIARLNLAAGLAVLAVVMLRRPMRWAFGPEVAYGLWAAPLFVVGASLLPARVMENAPLRPSLAPLFAGVSAEVLAAWALGAVLVALGMGRAQRRFLRQAQAGLSGPAVVGVLAPRIVMPPDDGRFTPQERELVRAHERAHVERGDTRAGAWIAAGQCLFWFNPLVHLGAHLARLDQEVACDATVLRGRRSARALYARTLLKTQLGGAALPLGCMWPPRAAHPLEVRVRLLSEAGRPESLLGMSLVAILVLGGAVGAWAVKPPIPLVRFTPKEELADNQPAMSVIIIRAPARR